MIQFFFAFQSNGNKEDENLGICRIYTTVKKNGFQCNLTELIEDVPIESQLDQIDLSCQYFGMSINNGNARFFFKVASYIKKNKPEAVLFMGSVFATNCSHLLMNDCKELDFVVLGMGEMPIIDVLTAVKKDPKCLEMIIREHPNIVTRSDQTEKIPCNTQISQLEWPVRNQRRRKNEISFSMYTKHGCSGHCSFCSIRQRASTRDYQDVFNEIKHLYETHGIQCFEIFDSSIEDFGRKGKENLNKLCLLLLEYPVKFSLSCQIRAESFIRCPEDRELLKLMIEAGFSFYVGIESANNTDLQLFNKRASVEDNIEILNFLMDNNGHFKYGFIMFTPYSTVDAIKSNFAFLTQYKCANIYAYMSVLQIFYNSDMYYKLKNDNLLLDSYHYIDNITENAVRYLNPTVQSIIEFISNILKKDNLMLGANEYLNLWRNYDFLSGIIPGSELKMLKMKLDEKIVATIVKYFSILYENNDLIKAEEEYHTFEAEMVKYYQEATILNNRLVKTYMRFRRTNSITRVKPL